jgi:hypothetical protein
MEQTRLEPAEIIESLRREDPEHPALTRLARRLADDGSVAEVITSYDRMHHRHSRA